MIALNDGPSLPCLPCFNSNLTYKYVPFPQPKKKFIDKKNSVTFRLVNRSQQDPLYVDETAPQNVLLPVRVPEKYANLAGGIKRQATSGPNVSNNFTLLERQLAIKVVLFPLG